MELQITKHEHKPHIILYKRDNSSVTWMKGDEYFVRHDLSHFAIEQSLGYTAAFMGMVNNGMEIRDFENREKRLAIVITEQACYAENMANLFLLETREGFAENFNAVVASAFTNMQMPYAAPVLSEQQITTVRKQLAALIAQWEALPAGETLTLTF